MRNRNMKCRHGIKSYRKQKGSGQDMDQIRIEQLEVFAKHGAIPEENVLGQKFLVSAVLFTDTRKAGRNDQLDQTISYGRGGQII